MARLESPDEVLVMAAILGDLEAFEELVLRYRAAVVRLARTIVGANYAEDVAQDALLLAFKALPTIEEPGKFAAWLSAITRHRAFRFNKRERAQLSKRVGMDEIPLKRIAAFMGVPLSTVKWRLHRGKELLRENLRSEFQQEHYGKRERVS